MYQLHHILEVTLFVYGTKRYSGNRAFNSMLAGSISRCNVSFGARIFLSFTGIRKFLRTYSRHRISNSDPFREQGTNTPLVIGRETGHLDDLLAKYSIQTQQSLEPSTYAELLTTAYLMVEEIRTST